MSTYIKGANTYLPDIKPFTPDYKFLSAVLDTRTDKYDANYQALNNLYNKVVYADLSRADNIDKRNQYTSTIAPQLEKVSGLDLSVMQNADMAKSVFAPFFEDDVLVKDIMFTSAYKREMQDANRLLDSADPDVSDKWWDPGIKALNYQMEDFINATSDQALAMGMPKYVPDADLFKLATNILEEADPQLSMEVDRYNTIPNPNFNKNKEIGPNNMPEVVDPYWIITEKNGAVVTGPALELIKGKLLNDPRVQRAYQTDAFVKSRDFAAAGMADGMFATVEDGQMAWANETIKRIEDINAVRMGEESVKLESLKAANVRWDNYEASEGIIEGSDLDNLKKENLSLVEATQASLNNMMGIDKEAKLPVKGLNGNLNKAYSMLLAHNIGNDMLSAATNYSLRDYKYEMRENEYGLIDARTKADLSKIEANHRARLREISAKGIEDRKTAQYESDLELASNPLFNLFGTLMQSNVEMDNPNTISAAVGVDGDDFDLEDINVLDINSYQTIEGSHALTEKKVDDIVNSLQVLNTEGNAGNNQSNLYTIPIDGKDFTGNIAAIRSVLLNSEKNEETGDITNYTNSSDVDTLWDKYYKEIGEFKKITVNNGPAVVQSQAYRELYGSMYGYTDQNGQYVPGTYDQASGHKSYINKINSMYEDNIGTLMNLAMAEDQEDDGLLDIKEMTKKGMPGVLSEGGGVKSKEDFINDWVEKARQNYYYFNTRDLPKSSNPKDIELFNKINIGGNRYAALDSQGRGTYDFTRMRENFKPITVDGKVVGVDINHNRSGRDIGTNNRGYAELESRGTFRSGYNRQFDEGAAENDAEYYYNTMTNNLNGAMTGAITFSDDGTPNVFRTGTYNSIRDGRTGDFASLLNNPTYKYNYNPQPNSMSADATAETMNFLNQINSMDAQNTPYGIYVGNLSDFDEDEAFEVNDLGRRVYNEFKKDSQWWSNPKNKTSDSKKVPTATLTYMSTFGDVDDATKTHAAYNLNDFDSWLESKTGTTNNPGIFSNDEVEKIKKGGISFIFDQDSDNNPKAVKEQYYSFVNNGILESQNGIYQYSEPGQIGPAGFVKVVPQGNGEFNILYNGSIYQTGGTYIQTGTQLKRADMTLGFRGLDDQVSQIISELQLQNYRNVENQKADQRTNSNSSLNNEN